MAKEGVVAGRDSGRVLIRLGDGSQVSIADDQIHAQYEAWLASQGRVVLLRSVAEEGAKALAELDQTKLELGKAVEASQEADKRLGERDEKIKALEAQLKAASEKVAALEKAAAKAKPDGK